MSVTVTLSGGGTNQFMLAGDTYVELDDGSLDVNRSGERDPWNYARGSWSTVRGDARLPAKRPFWG
jgi:hypothetical protein